MTCSSRYTVDETQTLACDLTKHSQTFRGEDMHGATAYGIRWTWKDREADK